MRFGNATVVVGICVVRVEGNGAIVVIDGTVVIAFVRFGSATVVIGRCVVGVEGNGAGAIGNGAVVIAFATFGNATVVVGTSVVGVDGDDVVVVSDGIVIFACIDICITAISISETSRVEVERFREGVNRASVITIQEIRMSGEKML